MPIQATTTLLPPKPEEPLNSDCCGTGCTPCVFDIYKEKFKSWEKEIEKIATGVSSPLAGALKDEDFISPYENKRYTVEEIVGDCDSCKILHFKPQGEDATAQTSIFNSSTFPVKLGQHVLLKIDDKSRQYTVLDITKNGTFTIIFKIYPTGRLTPLVDRLEVGQCVEIRGPFGKEFSYKPKVYGRLTMLVAGTGIAPMCRIIDVVLENDVDETRIKLLFACKNENEILLLYKLKEWSRHWNFQVQYFLSTAIDLANAQQIHYGSEINFKKLDKTEIEKVVTTDCKGLTNFLICGTKSFEKDMLNYLTSLGVTEELIKVF